LALRALDEWWESSPQTKGGMSKADLFSVGVKEFQEAWAFLYFPVQSIGHAFMGAMERDDVRYEEMIERQQASEEQEAQGNALDHHPNTGQGCVKHDHCDDSHFCNTEKLCEPNEECHFNHDSINGKCPKGPAKQVGPGGGDRKDDL